MAMFRNVNLAPIDTSGFERAGAAYGQMFQNLGNTIASSVDKYRAKQEKKQSEEAMERMIKGLPSNVLESFGVDTQDPNMVKQFSKDMVKNPSGANALFAMSSALVQQDLDRREMKMREDTADVTNALTTFRTAALGQDVAQKAAMFPTEQALSTARLRDLGASTDLTNAQRDSLEQSTEANRRLLDGQIAAQDLENEFTKARIENEKKKQSNADRMFNQQEAIEDRLQAAQNFDQAIKAQQSVIQAKLADSEILTNKRRLELQKEQQDNTATMQTLNYFLDADRFDFTKKFTKKEFNQKKAQFKQEMRIKRKQLDQSERQLVAAIKSGKVGDNLKRAQTKHYEALAQAGPSVSSSEFERIVNKAGFSPEQVDELYKDRALQLAGAEKAPTAQEVADLVGKHKPDGVYEVSSISGLMNAAEANGVLNGEPVKIKEDKGQKFLEFHDSNARPVKIAITPEIEAQVDIFRKNTTRAITPDTGQPSVPAPSMTDQDFGAAIDAEFR